jgi:hypothetical protein
MRDRTISAPGQTVTGPGGVDAPAGTTGKRPVRPGWPRPRGGDVHLHLKDPRQLLATQSGLQRPALEHYLGSVYRQIGRPYAEPHSPGNKYPVVYRYPRPTDGRLEAVILAGHHRSAAALLQGRTVLVRVVDGQVRAKVDRG